MLFHIVEDCFVILRQNGLYRQAKVYRRGNFAYAGIGGGFVRLMHNGGTSRPNIGWEDLTASPEIRIARDGCPRIESRFQIEGSVAAPEKAA